ncbi:MAG: hypothetical protein COU69_04350 [Candidatus Pacebacteria bacterium CG10_big_fil_rev_8_21_14_0_10_56_10]|nr:MAG: hypothetical protein COU69_04350 [Candidatus Pacebacteria bacterium CG10_big_fil_rev_8_21_14_0_10_56_10]
MISLGPVDHHFAGINDSTLREGEQYNGAEFSLADQQEILRLLHSIGVDTAEVGNPIVPEINRHLRLLTAITDRPPLMAHIRNREPDLEAALGVGVEGVHLLCTADPSRLKSMRLSLAEHTAQMRRHVQRAQQAGLIVRVSVEHGLEKRFFADTLKIFKVADSLGVDRVQVADTRGVLFPWEVAEVVHALSREVQTQLGVHLHNDLGHAVGNAIYALRAGANWIDTSLLGLGERTGITPLSSLLVSLNELGPRLVARYDLSLLAAAERRTAEIVGLDVPHNLITSPTAFSHKAGIHVNGLKKQGPATYEAIGPELVGNQRVIVTGSRLSGKN